MPMSGWAQGIQLTSGTVQTEAGAPLPGATVIIKGTYAGNSTNEEGLLQLKADFSKGPVVLLINPKAPLKDPGLSVRGGNCNLLDGQLRYTQKIGEWGASKSRAGPSWPAISLPRTRTRPRP